MKHFANKLWNIARYVLATVPSEVFADLNRPDATSDADHDILAKLDQAVAGVTRNLERFALHEAAQQAYDFAWHELADKYLEAQKASPNAPLLAYCLTTTLKLLHPFTPFVTEELWGRIYGTNDPKKLLMVAPWPK
jgi:valyl-tRNA synthetase